MLNYPHATQPTGVDPAYQRLSSRQTLLTALERSIEAAAKSGGYLWQQKLAVKRLADLIPTKPGLVLGTARSIYMALTEVASDQRTPTRARASNAHLAKLADFSADTVHRYIREFERIGIVTVVPGRGQYDPNTYILLLIPTPDQPADLEAATLPLADGAGQSRGGGGAGSADPASDGRGGTGARSEAVRGSMGATQIQNERLRTKRTNKQAGVGGLVVDYPATRVDEHPAAEPPPAASTQIPQPALPLTTEQQVSVQQLTGIGVQRRVAEELATTCSSEVVAGWVEYTRTAKGITSPAGFVRTKLRAGEQPPRPSQPDPQNWVAEYAAEQRKRQEEEARKLLARYGVDQPTLARWLTVRERLAAEHEAAYYLCFKDAFLACPDAHTALLVLPPRVPLAEAAQHTALLQELLTAQLGYDLSIRFEHPRSGNEPINFAGDQPPVSTEPDEPEPVTAPTHEPATDWMQSGWRAAADDLRTLVGDELWHSWLAQVRLVGRDGATWLLRQPPGNVLVALAERWSERIAVVLTGIYGRVVRLRFLAVG